MNNKISLVSDFDLSQPLDWSAILAGAFVALSLQSLFNLLAIGLGILSFTMDIESMRNMGMVTFGWIMSSGIISTFSGSWIAGKGSGTTASGNGIYQGLATWSVCTLLTLLLVSTSAGIFIGGTANMINDHIDISQESMIGSSEKNPSFFTEENNTSNSSSEYDMQKEVSSEEADDVATALSSMAFITTFAFILSGIAGAIGGLWGVNSNRYASHSGKSFSR